MAMPQWSATMWVALAQVAWTLGDSARTVACAESALVHEPGRTDARAILARFGGASRAP
jgi:hypothetical protein